MTGERVPAVPHRAVHSALFDDAQAARGAATIAAFLRAAGRAKRRWEPRTAGDPATAPALVRFGRIEMEASDGPSGLLVVLRSDEPGRRHSSSFRLARLADAPGDLEDGPEYAFAHLRAIRSILLLPGTRTAPLETMTGTLPADPEGIELARLCERAALRAIAAWHADERSVDGVVVSTPLLGSSAAVTCRTGGAVPFDMREGVTRGIPSAASIDVVGGRVVEIRPHRHRSQATTPDAVTTMRILREMREEAA